MYSVFVFLNILIKIAMLLAMLMKMLLEQPEGHNIFQYIPKPPEYIYIRDFELKRFDCTCSSTNSDGPV